MVREVFCLTVGFLAGLPIGALIGTALYFLLGDLDGA